MDPPFFGGVMRDVRCVMHERDWGAFTHHAQTGVDTFAQRV